MITAKQLKNDLAAIETTVDQADVPGPVKMLLKELIEWNKGFVDVQAAPASAVLEKRVGQLETDVESLLSEIAEEGISLETGTVLMTGYEQSRLLSAAVRALVTGTAVTLDELTKKRFLELLNATDAAIDAATQLVAELVDEDDETEEDEDEDEEDADGDAVEAESVAGEED